MGQTGGVAVDDQQRRHDLYDVPLRSHDERVEEGSWTYYVRGVKRDDELLPRVTLWGELLVDVPMLAARGIKRLVSRGVPWTVAVVRLGSVKTWNDAKPEVVHREVLPAGDGAEARIAQLVDEVKAGRFTPTT